MVVAKEDMCNQCGKELPFNPILRTKHQAACQSSSTSTAANIDYLTDPVEGSKVADYEPDNGHYEYPSTDVPDRVTFNPAPSVIDNPKVSNDPIWSKYGEYILENALRHVGTNLILFGDSGWGKTYLAQHLAKATGRGFNTINCFEGMSMDPLVGNPVPVNTDNGIEVRWHDGDFTDAVRVGKLFLMEEFFRADDTLRSMIYSSLDYSNRMWTISQAGGIAESKVPVHDDFWFIATGNPPGGPYTAFQLDPAMDSRLTKQYRVNQPLADESAVLRRKVNGDTALIVPVHGEDAKEMSCGDFVNRMMKIAHDTRPPADLTQSFLLPYEEARARCLNTRDLFGIADALLKGDSPVEVASTGVHGYGEQNRGIQVALVSHFAEGSW